MTVEDLARNLARQGSTVSYCKPVPRKRGARPYALPGALMFVLTLMLLGR